METPTTDLARLATIEGASCVTLYLNTRLKEPTAREQARQFVRRRIERALLAAGDDAREDLERIRGEALRRVETPDAAAVAIFACAAKGLFKAIPLEVPVEDQLVVGNEPALKQLAALSGTYDRTLLVLVSAEDARIYELLLGRVESVEAVSGADINKTPGWTQLRYQRQVREQIERHLREVASRVTVLFDRGRAPQLVVGGAQPTIDRFLHELPNRLRTRVKDVVSLAPGAQITDVVHAAMQASNAEERAKAVDGVKQAVDMALSDGPAALGLDEVLEAAQQKRLMTLFVDPAFRREGWRCRDCGLLAKGLEVPPEGERKPGTCVLCSGKSMPVELGEALVRQAIVQGGEVDLVPRSSMLIRFDGVAAKLRW